MSADAATPKLLYFAIRGRAEPIRLALIDVGVAFEEEHPASWAAIKDELYHAGVGGVGGGCGCGG